MRMLGSIILHTVLIDGEAENIFWSIKLPTGPIEKLIFVIEYKVEELIAKEKETQEKLMLKHLTVVGCFEKKLSGKEVENRVASHQQKLAALRQDIDDLLETIDEFC